MGDVGEAVTQPLQNIQQQGCELVRSAASEMHKVIASPGRQLSARALRHGSLHAAARKHWSGVAESVRSSIESFDTRASLSQGIDKGCANIDERKIWTATGTRRARPLAPR